MKRISINNDYIVISNIELGNNYKAEYILSHIQDNHNEEYIDNIVNQGIEDMFSKLFNCKY